VREQQEAKPWVRKPPDRSAPADQPDLGQPLVSPRRDYGRLLLEDLKIRQFIMKTLPQAAISKVVIERPAKLCRVSIYAARPGVIIGKKGADIEKLRKQLGR
jgi:ribosomal protein S3